MEPNARLSERMQAETLRFAPDDDAWNLFVRDHKKYLRNKATRTTFTAEELSKYRYRPEEFYVDHGGIVQATWIFLYINDIRDISEFDETRRKLFILPWEEIRQLHEMYKNSESHVYDEEA